MTNLTNNFEVIITGDYASSFKRITGTKKEVLRQLRGIAKEMRRDSRLLKNLPDNVMPIDKNLHTSRLVTMASFELNEMGGEDLCELMSAHGVKKFEFVNPFK